MKRVIFAALTLVAMASCTKTDPEMDLALEGEVRITSSISTRASGEDWGSNDWIGVYMNIADGSVGLLGANVPYSTTGDGEFDVATTTPITAPLYYPQGDKEVDLLAYYPYDKGLTAASAYGVDVSDQDDLTLIDLMIAKAEDKSKSTKAVDLTFYHKLSNVVITIEEGKGFTAADLAGVKATITGTKATATYDLTKGDNETPISDYAAQASKIEVPVNTVSGELIAEAILIPQSLSGVTFEFLLTNGDTYSAKVNTASFLAGNKYQYTATINKTSVTLSAANISPWDDGNGDNGDDLTADKVIPDMVYKDEVFEIYTDKGLKAFADLVNGVENTTANVSWGDGEITDFSTERKNTINGKLMADIDLKDICGAEIGVGGAAVSWIPIGNSTNYTYGYKGKFDGNGKGVEGLYIYSDSNERLALFGFIYGAEIKSLEVSGATTGYKYVAGIVAEAYSSSLIKDCISNVNVTSSDGNSGGIAGCISNSNIIACSNHGSVKGIGSNSSRYYGGVVGKIANSSKVISSYNSAALINGSNGCYGGVVGYISGGSIMSCYWVEGGAASYGNGYAYNDTEATKCADIAALNRSVDGLNGGITLWNIANAESQIPWQFTEGADSTTPPTLVDAPIATVDGLSFDSDNDCYNISNANGLVYFAKLVNSGYNNIDGKLIASFSLSTVCGEDIGGTDVDVDWTPIADYCINRISYTGVFNGNDQTIEDIYIDDTNYSTGTYQGLFGRMEKATIKNLTVKGSVSGYYDIGGIVGYAVGDSGTPATITSCNSQVEISGDNDYCGGIAGYAGRVNISSCSNSGNISGEGSNYGGIVGYSSDYTAITDCKNSGSIELTSYGEYNAGGIAGSAISESTIIDCHNSGAVTAKLRNSSYIGGVVGYISKANTVACSNNAAVTGADDSIGASSYIGGIVGCTNNYSSAGGYAVIACYNSGVVSDPSGETNDVYPCVGVGGVVGYHNDDHDVIACYNTAEVTSVKNRTSVGGITGYAATSDISISNYWYNASSSDQAVNGIGSINGGEASDSGAEKLSTIADLNGKVDALNNAIYTWNELNSNACPYKYVAGSGNDAPTLVSGKPGYTTLAPEMTAVTITIKGDGLYGTFNATDADTIKYVVGGTDMATSETTTAENIMNGSVTNTTANGAIDSSQFGVEQKLTSDTTTPVFVYAVAVNSNNDYSSMLGDMEQ